MQLQLYKRVPHVGVSLLQPYTCTKQTVLPALCGRRGTLRARYGQYVPVLVPKSLSCETQNGYTRYTTLNKNIGKYK